VPPGEEDRNFSEGHGYADLDLSRGLLAVRLRRRWSAFRLRHAKAIEAAAQSVLTAVLTAIVLKMLGLA